MLDTLRGIPDFSLFGGDTKSGNEAVRMGYYGGAGSVPWGNIADPLKWDYSEW